MRIILTFVLLLFFSGCAEPIAVVRLVDSADHALVNVQQADNELEKAILHQVEQQFIALDEAFLSDMQALAGDQGELNIDDIKTGKRFYDSQRSKLEQSRRDLQESFRRRASSLEAARQLLRYAHDLVIRNRSAWYDAEKYMQFITESRQNQLFPTEGDQP